jgi:hypothetical protein
LKREYNYGLSDTISGGHDPRFVGSMVKFGTLNTCPNVNKD